jgi:hypothetical protein
MAFSGHASLHAGQRKHHSESFTAILSLTLDRLHGQALTVVSTDLLP